MQIFNAGDLVLTINSDYNPRLIGQAGIVAMTESFISGFDKYGNHIADKYVVVDLQDNLNRFGTTLWYFKPGHLIKISPDHEKVVSYHWQCA